MDLLIATIAAPLSLFASWAALAALVAGVGLLVRRSLGARDGIDAHELFCAFWTGVFAITLALQVWHFFLPVATPAALLVGVAGIAGLTLSARGIARAARESRAPRNLLLFALFLFWWFGNQGLGEVAAFDTGMYHVPAVEWLRAHALVPGLANLHGRFGFNNSSFLLAALLESAPWKDGSVFLLNGVFLTVALARALHAASRWSGTRGAERVQAAVDTLMLAPIVAVAATPALFRSLNADVPASMAVFAGISLLAGRLAGGAGHRAARDVPRETQLAERGRHIAGRDAAVTATLAFALAAAFKLSVALIALPAWLMAAGTLVRERRTAPAQASPQPAEPVIPGFRDRMAGTGALAVAVLASVLLIGTWLARGVVLSGYPLYPMRLLALPVDWRVPAEQAAAESAWIRFFAWTWNAPGMYNAVDPVWLCQPATLIGSWVRSLLRVDVLWQVVVPGGLALGMTVAALRRGTARAGSAFLLWLAALFAGCAAWLLLAPRPLFGFAMFWSCAAVACALRQSVTGDPHGATRPPGRFLVPAAVGLAVAAVAGNAVHAAQTAESSARQAAIAAVYTVPDPDSWFIATRWEYPTRRFVTESNLELLVPSGHRCGRAPLPCTSHPAANLRLRRPGDVSGGFAVDGEWRAERFPSPFTNFLEVWRSTRAGSCAS